MAEFIRLNTMFANDLRFSLSWGALFLGFMVLVMAIGIIWEWKDNKPRDEKFWFACGIFFHWFATINACLLYLLQESGAILARTEHFLVGANRIFVIIGGLFYLRALTNHWKENLWKWTAAFLVCFIFTVYLYRIL